MWKNNIVLQRYFNGEKVMRNTIWAWDIGIKILNFLKTDNLKFESQINKGTTL
jgi:carbohydrate-binding DOMON domain-containing protein